MSVFRNVFVPAVLMSALIRPAGLTAENWPNWRGPDNNGISRETSIATEWSEDRNVLWKVKLPGPAGATPVIWGDHLFLTTVAGDRLQLLCFDRNGDERWVKTITHGNKDVRGDEGNSASPSPLTDGKHVWAFFGNGILACFDFDGTQVWSVDLQERYGKFDIAFGMTSTPVLHGDVLYQQLIHGDGNAETREATVFAIDKTTGKGIWAVPRPSDGYAENEHSYASPMLYDDGERQFLVSHGADYVVAHRLSDGKEIWRSGNLNVKSKYDPTLRFVSSPATAPGIIVVPSAKRGPTLAFRPGLSGDVTDDPTALLWSHDKTPDVPSPLIVDGLVYLCMQDGNLFCLDARTGKEYYFERTHRQRHRASPVYADGHIYLTARDGLVSVVKVGKTFELVAQNQLPDTISASPAISDGTIYFRGFDYLWAIGTK